MRAVLLSVSLIALSLSACGGSASTGGQASAPAATTAATTRGDRIGIPACDDYLDKYQACVADKVPAEARAQFSASLAATRTSWKSMADNAATKPALENACQQASNGAKQAMSAYGCSF